MGLRGWAQQVARQLPARGPADVCILAPNSTCNAHGYFFGVRVESKGEAEQVYNSDRPGASALNTVIERRAPRTLPPDPKEGEASTPLCRTYLQTEVPELAVAGCDSLGLSKRADGRHAL